MKILALTLAILIKTAFCSRSINKNQAESDSIFNPFMNDDIMVPVQELDIEEPYLWQMAAFAAHQMSDKRLYKYKLMTLTSAAKTDSTYRLQMTLKRIKMDDPIQNNDVLHCTVEINEDEQRNWELDNFGCTLPAMVRVRDRSMDKKPNSLDNKQKQKQKYQQPLGNTISNEISDSTGESQQNYKMETISPFLYRQQIQPMRYYSSSSYPYQEYRPYFRFYY